MNLIEIKEEKLQRLMKAAMNAGGTLEADMLEALKEAATEHEFEVKWFWKLRNERNRISRFYNTLAERLGEEKIHIFT